MSYYLTGSGGSLTLGLPLDGLTGQLLAKASDTDFDLRWVDPPAGTGGAGSGTVTSVGLAAPAGFSVSGSPITGSGTLTMTFAAGYSLPLTASQTNWDTAFSERLRWDGSATGLVAATGRTSLELGGAAVLNVGTSAGTVAAGNDSRFSVNLSYTASTRALASSTGTGATLPLFSSTDPGLVAGSGGGTANFLRADGTWAAPPAGGGGGGTVTSVGLTVPEGLSVTGSPVTTSGTFAITLATGYSIPTIVGQTNWNTAYNERLQWDGSATALADPSVGRTSLGLGTAATLNYPTSGNANIFQVVRGGDTRLTTNLSYTASTRALGSSTGTGATLPLFSSADAGLVAGSGGGTANFLRADGTWAVPPGSGGSGTVTSVGLSLPGLFSVSGSPVTSSGTLTATLVTQTANTILAGPTTGSAAAPAFRAMVAQDLPASVFSLHSSLSAASNTYTLDATIANEFTASAAVAGNTTITATNLSSIPSGYVWRCVFRFAYTSGAITFAAPAGFTAKSPATAPTLTAGRTYDVIARVLGGGTVIDYRYGGDGYTT